MTKLSRRSFLAATGLGTAAAVTGVGTAFVAAAPGEPTGDRLVLIFLAGGADGLTMTPPYGYSSYRDLRPNLGVPDPGAAGGALELTTASSGGNAVFPTGIEGVVGLHPSFKPLHDTVWKQGQLAVLPMMGLPGLSRSHFSAQKNFHYGGKSNARAGGWLGRAIDAKAIGGRYTSVHDPEAGRPIAGSTQTAGIINALGDFAVTGFDDNTKAATALDSLYEGGDSVSAEGRKVLGGIRDIASLDTRLRPGYSRRRTGRALSEIATMFEAFPEIRVASMQLGGWDHHSNLGRGGDPNGKFAQMTAELTEGLMGFINDTKLDGVTVMVITEFGRTINENSSGGTDHGRAGTFMVMGQGIRGGVYGDDYPDVLTLGGRDRADSPILTDFRKAATDVVGNRFQVDPQVAFPDYSGGGLGITR
ncbi:MAG: DUF1501 domain-containing protein [Actinomycetota bacterium]